MKSPFYKKIIRSLLLAGATFIICNCGDESVTESNVNNNADVQNNVIVVDQPSFLYEKDGTQYVISTDGTVRDTDGNVLGIADITSGNIAITDPATQQPVFIGEGVEFSTLEVIQPTIITSTAWILSADQTYVIYPDGNVTDAAGNPIGTIVFEEDSFVGSIIGLDGTPIMANVDVNSLKVHEANTTPSKEDTEPPESSSSTDTSANSSNSVENPTPNVESSNSLAKSSSSTSSSSSTAKSSSSQNGNTSGSYTIKYINGGASGSGWATRYWDCCKPHCAWPDKGGIKAHACDASGNRIDDDGATSMCDNGNAGTCKSQIPIVVNDTLAFAFAAVPGNAGGQCGKCFDLAFTGKGKYATDNHAKLKGKHLIVIASNIGYDVEAGQFDVMIPGGGFGIFDGCSAKMGWGPQGARYGGLLTECEESSGYKASTYKSCLTQKCNSSFSSDPQAKEGCLFLANWMNAAGNPLHNYKEVECPKELLDKF